MNNGNKINLLQMQDYFEGQMENIHTLSDLELSENDYRSLSAKLKAFSFFAGSDNDLADYMISIVVYSTYTLIYGTDMKEFGAALSMLLSKGQYIEKMRLNMYKDVFFDYGLNTYDINDTDLRMYCQKITARHAGVPNSEKYEFYTLLSDYLECEDAQLLYKQVFEQLPKRTKFIMELMDEDMRRELLLHIKSMMNDVVDGIFVRDELLKRYPKLSVSLIDRCILWNENRNQQIRFNIK